MQIPLNRVHLENPFLAESRSIPCSGADFSQLCHCSHSVPYPFLIFVGNCPYAVEYLEAFLVNISHMAICPLPDCEQQNCQSLCPRENITAPS